MLYVIYKICSDDCPDFIYIGSTKNFTNRKCKHKHNCNNGCSFKLYNKIREYGGWDNWRMVIIDEIGDVSKTQAKMKEEEWRLKLQANLNTKKCHLTEEELKQYFKEYRETHKQKSKEYQAEYRETHKE
jgi:hypothetical protein